MVDYKRKAERRREREAQYEAEREAEEIRRIKNPTTEEQICARLDALMSNVGVSPEIEEMARLLKWHITGSEF